MRTKLNTPGAETPWGKVQRAWFTILHLPEASNELARAEINLHAENAQTRWATTTNLALTIHLVSLKSDTNLAYADLDLTANSIEWRVVHATRFDSLRKRLCTSAGMFPSRSATARATS